MKREKLLTKDDIWNAVIDVMGEYDFPTENKVANDEELWRLFQALENDEIEEDDFYNVINEADSEYDNLNGKIGVLHFY